MSRSELDFQNILVIHFGQLGDMILTLPALDALRRRFANALITVFAADIPLSVLGLVNVCDDTIIFNRSELRQMSKVKATAQIISLLREIRQRKFDLLIDLHSLYESNILSFLSGARHRLLAKRGNRSLDFLSNFRPEPPEFDRSLHLTKHYLGVVLPLGIEASNIFPPIRMTVGEKDLSVIPKPTKVVGMFPGAGNRSRCWPVVNFAELAWRLTAEADIQIEIFLGPEENDIREQIANILPAEVTIHDEMSIGKLAAALSQLDVLISNDTGPMHLAGLVGTPIVLVMDKAAPATYIPVVSAISVINHSSIADITVDDVLTAVTSALAASK